LQLENYPSEIKMKLEFKGIIPYYLM